MLGELPAGLFPCRADQRGAESLALGETGLASGDAGGATKRKGPLAIMRKVSRQRFLRSDKPPSRQCRNGCALRHCRRRLAGGAPRRRNGEQPLSSAQPLRMVPDFFSSQTPVLKRLASRFANVVTNWWTYASAEAPDLVLFERCRDRRRKPPCRGSLRVILILPSGRQRSTDSMGFDALPR